MSLHICEQFAEENGIYDWEHKQEGCVACEIFKSIEECQLACCHGPCDFDHDCHYRKFFVNDYSKTQSPGNGLDCH